jgi:hypothetical protein
MLDVHAPEHRIHGFRDFLVHLLTITVGLLIALSLEASVGAMLEWRYKSSAPTNFAKKNGGHRRYPMPAVSSVDYFARKQKPTSMLFPLCSLGRLLTIVRSQTSSRTT